MKTNLPQGSLISYMANKVKTYGGINMAQGIPAYEPPSELLALLSVNSKMNFHQYAPGVGNKQLVEQILKDYDGHGFSNDNILIVNGATEALSTIFTYLFRKIGTSFTTLAFNPVYEVYRHLPRLFNLPFLPFDLNAKGDVDFDDLKRYIVQHNVKVVFLASPGNPLGKVWTDIQLNKMVDLALELDVYLIIDAVYSDLYFDEKPYYPLQRICPNVFYTNSFSKKFSITGWRIGYLISDSLTMPLLRDVHDYIGLSSPSILQQSLAEYLEKYKFGADYCVGLRQKLKSNYASVSDQLNQLHFKVVKAEGGYFVWAKLPDKYENGFEFAEELYRKQKVAVVPGVHFNPEATDFVRFNIAINPNDVILAMEKIKEFVRY